MTVSSHLIFMSVLGCGIVTGLVISPAEAYIDPGTTGMLSQLLYVLFYGVLGIFSLLFASHQTGFTGRQTVSSEVFWAKG